MAAACEMRRLGLLMLLAAGLITGTARAQDMAIAPQFEEAGNFHRGVAPVLVDKQWGLINRSGAFVVRPRYAAMRRGGDGLFGVEDGALWGYIDTTGKVAIQPKFEDAEPFEHGLAPVKTGGRWGYVRPDGTMETPFTFLEIGGRDGTAVSARDAQGWTVFRVGVNGPPTRGEIEDARRTYSISEGTVVVQLSTGEALHQIDTFSSRDYVGTQPIFPRYGSKDKFISIRRMSQGFAPAATAPNKWGYLHRNSGEYLWRNRFEDAQQFMHGFAPVKIGGKWGYIDRGGRMIVQPTYDAAFPFRGDSAIVRQAEKRGFLRINPDGVPTLVVAPRYEDAFRFTEGLAPVKIGGRWGYIADERPRSELVKSDIVDIRNR